MKVVKLKSLIDSLQKVYKNITFILHTTFQRIHKISYLWNFLKNYTAYIKFVLNIFLELYIY